MTAAFLATRLSVGAETKGCAASFSLELENLFLPSKDDLAVGHCANVDGTTVKADLATQTVFKTNRDTTEGSRRIRT